MTWIKSSLNHCQEEVSAFSKIYLKYIYAIGPAFMLD